jgi:photosystem II stability/assembly factor-like uncharacterized protein
MKKWINLRQITIVITLMLLCTPFIQTSLFYSTDVRFNRESEHIETRFSFTEYEGLVAAESASSADTDWKIIGQGGGGNIVDVVCHPTDPDVLWVVTDLTGIFKSTDGGETWDRKSGPIEREELLFEWLRGMDEELAYDLSDPNIMYWAMDGGIYTTPGLYKSTDGGESWFKIPGSPDLAPGSIVVDNNGVIYGIKHKKMYVSTNKGATWQKKPDVPTYYCGNEYDWRRRYRIFIYTTNDNKIFIGDRRPGSGVFYTSDMGDTWIQVLKGTEVMDIACSPVTPGLVVALENDGRIFQSTDGGENFEVIETINHSYYKWGTWPAFYGGIEINKNDHIMTVGRWGLGISTDAGKNFNKFEEKDCEWDPGDYIFPNRLTYERLFKCNKMAASPKSGKWYFVDGHLVKCTEDNGLSWKAQCKGIDILCVYTPPVIDITNPSIIHVGAGDNGHYYTTDLGKTWKTSESRMQNVDGLAQDPNNPSIFYKMYGRKKDQGAVHKSTDGGVTWEKLTNIPVTGFRGRSEWNSSFYSGWVGKLCVDPANSRRIFASHRAMDGVYMSSDGGYNFGRVLQIDQPWQLEVTKDGSIFVCTWDSTGLFRSTNHGESFEKIHDGMVHDFAVHPQNNDIIFANAGSFSHAWATAKILPNYELNRNHKDEGKGNLFKTTNGGKTWSVLGQYDGFALYIEPNYPNVMLMSTRDGGEGIMRSLDGGESWISIHNSHDNYHPRGFVYGGVPGRVYSWNHNLARLDNVHIQSIDSNK